MKSTCLVADKDGTEIEVKKGKVDADKCIKDYNLLKKKLGFIIIFENVEGTATAVSASRIPKGLLLFASC